MVGMCLCCREILRLSRLTVSRKRCSFWFFYDSFLNVHYIRMETCWYLTTSEHKSSEKVRKYILTVLWHQLLGCAQKSFWKQRAEQMLFFMLCVMQSWFTPYFLVILVLSLDFSSVVTVRAEPPAPPSKAPTLPQRAGLRERQEEDGKHEGDIPNTSVTAVTEPLTPPSLTPPPSPAATQTRKVEAELEKQKVEEEVEVKVEERKRTVNEEPRKKPFWLDDDDLPPIMWDARWTVCMCLHHYHFSDLALMFIQSVLMSLNIWERKRTRVKWLLSTVCLLCCNNDTL